MTTEILPDLKALRNFGKRFAKGLAPGAIVLLDGPLGSGKTTLCQILAQELGVAELLSSPSYALIQEYSGRCPVFHMDLYRLGGEEEFELIGGPEYLDCGGICLIEWGQRLGRSFWGPEVLTIELDFQERGRIVRWQGARP
ncbi:MAG: tRNA (adenosine(37)-N6)-threonylcarbamoyltransferase complex ATPase subunit type 1 TsaE [Spirochaetales bacterium]|nr:tRNA (adenosine(37)-N6)-threonylcarbamoyltransferase complex ATPase subunit type 1 TsaE [Spirochaetales bacterium]